MPVRLIVCGILLLVLPATCLQAEPALLYANDFESTTGALPRGWLSFGGQWGLAADDSAVLQQTLPAFRGLAQAAMQECNYQVEATVRALSCSGPWGVGVVAYWQPGVGCYRLSNFGNVLVLWREYGSQAEPLAAVRMEFKPQTYRLRLSVQNEAAYTALRGKVWALGEAEPENWTINGEDGANPLRHGRAGVFTGRASAIFSDFTISRGTPPGPSPTASDKTPDKPAMASAAFTGHWLYTGGEWQAARDTLRQNAAGSTQGFRAGAYAISAGWSDYTVQVSAKSAAGSRNQGFGLCAYWLGEGDHYELGQIGGNNLLLTRRVSGVDPIVLATVPFTVKKGMWYILKLRVENAPGGAQLRGKAWPARAGEPTKWQIEAQDLVQPRLSGGDVGLWTVDDVSSFDDLQVLANE